MSTITNVRNTGLESRIWNPVSVINFGSIAAADSSALIKSATGSELPNNETVTYNFPASNTSPTDGALTTGQISTPRTLTVTVTHDSAVVAMFVTAYGTDMYGHAIAEQFAVTGPGTSVTYTGKKAFASISSLVFTSASNAESNTVSVGTSTKIGLPYVLTNKNHIISFISGVVPQDSTDVKASATLTSDTTAPSNGDTVTVDTTTYTFKTNIPALGTLTSDTTAPVDGATVVIGTGSNARTYTFKDTLTTPAVAYEVFTDTSAENALANLKKAINATGVAGTDYGTGTLAHPQVIGTTLDATSLVISANSGLEGSAVATPTPSASPNSHMSWGAATLVGGDTPNAVWINGSAANALANLKKAINDSGTEGTHYGTGTVAHTTLTATDVNATTLKVEAIISGRDANVIPVTETSTHLSWGSSTLAGGAQSGVVSTLGVSSTPSLTTGDIRGLVDFDEALLATDANEEFSVWMVVPDGSEVETYGDRKV